MALIGSIAINMKVSTQAFTKGLMTASGALRGFAARAGSLGGKGLGLLGRSAVVAAESFRFLEDVAKKALLVGAVGAGGFYKMAKAATALGEQTDMLRVTFGEGVAKQIEDQAKVMGEAFGRSRSGFMESVGRIGGQFQGMGYTADEAAKLGIQFTKLAIDMASVKQISDEEAFTRMASGLAGESEAVRKWGVDLSEANLKLQAVNLGIVKQSRELTQAEKVQVRSILMDQKLAYAKGNLAKTAAGAENATKGLMGRLENLAAQIGTALLPIVASAMVQLQTGVQVLSMLWSDWTKGVVNESVGVVGSVQVQSDSVGFLEQSVIFVADAWQMVKGVFLTVQSYITAGIGHIVEVISYLASAIDGVLVSIGQARTGVSDILATYGEDLRRISGEQFAAANTALTAPSSAAGLHEKFKAANDRIKTMQSEAMKAGVNPADFKPTSAAAVKVSQPQFASAAVAGTSETTNAILKSRFGGGGARSPEDETAKNTKTIADYMKMIYANGYARSGGSKTLTSPQLAAAGFLGTFF